MRSILRADIGFHPDHKELFFSVANGFEELAEALERSAKADRIESEVALLPAHV